MLTPPISTLVALLKFDPLMVKTTELPKMLIWGCMETIFGGSTLVIVKPLTTVAD